MCIEWQAGSDACKKVVKFLQEEMGVKNVLHLEGGFGQWKKAGGPKADKPSHKDKA